MNILRRILVAALCLIASLSVSRAEYAQGIDAFSYPYFVLGGTVITVFNVDTAGRFDIPMPSGSHVLTVAFENSDSLVGIGYTTSAYYTFRASISARNFALIHAIASTPDSIQGDYVYRQATQEFVLPQVCGFNPTKFCLTFVHLETGAITKQENAGGFNINIDKNGELIYFEFPPDITYGQGITAYDPNADVIYANNLVMDWPTGSFLDTEIVAFRVETRALVRRTSLGGVHIFSNLGFDPASQFLYSNNLEDGSTTTAQSRAIRPPAGAVKGNRIFKFASAGADTVQGASSSKWINILGGAGNDSIVGSRFSDYLIGGPGADTMRGGLGNDLLEGGAQGDSLYGGGGQDTFIYRLVSDSLPSTPDQIGDFVRGQDKIGLRALDANRFLAGRQRFVFIGTAAFTRGAEGQLRAVAGRAEMDVNGDRVADMIVRVQPTVLLKAIDFLLQ